jgi:hypothetical protein
MSWVEGERVRTSETPGFQRLIAPLD